MREKSEHAAIAAIDARIVALLNERFSLARELPNASGSVPGNSGREQGTALLERLCRLNRGPMSAATLRALYREILAAERAMEEPLAVAFLGTASTFTHQAALLHFGSQVAYQPQPTIPDVFDAVGRDHAAYGVVPVENSTEGAVTYTLDMFTDTDVRICAEINMMVHHNLLSRSPQEEIRVVYSHPQVFGQCRQWLQRNLRNVPLVEVTSTTEAARRCAEEPLAGALASALAAECYELEVRAKNVEDFSGNMTRFLVIGRQDVPPTGDDKTSVLFVVRDRVGALYDSLAPLRAREINLTFIESRPSRRKNWDYYFFVDVVGHLSDANVREAFDELAEHCLLVKILGSYPRAVDANS